jgi:uncharacterized protein with FMN-binding domain
MKMFLKIALSVVIVLVLVAGGGIFYMTRGLESGSKLIINDVKPSLLVDGTYNGKYGSGRWANAVNVIIKDKKIIEIDVVRNLAFPPKPEVTRELINRVIQKQNSNVDVISGSTVSCKSYLKSIENALKK